MSLYRGAPRRPFTAWLRVVTAEEAFHINEFAADNGVANSASGGPQCRRDALPRR